MNYSFTKLLIICCLLLEGILLQGQDIHFSQFYNSRLNLNPALTGVFKGDLRFNGNYKQQWESVPVAYRSFSGAFDMKFLDRKLANGFLAGGILFNTDQAGDSKLSLNEVKLNAAYTYQLNDLNFVSIGFQFGMGQRSLNFDALRFHNQFSGDIFDPNLNSREDFSNTQVVFSDISSGLNWHVQLERTRTKLDIGVGLLHLNQPALNFFDGDDIKLGAKYNVYAMTEIQLHPQVDLVMAGIFSLQKSYKETVFNSGVKYFLNPKKGKNIAFQLGTAFRLGDALIPNFEIFYNAWQFGVSYDMNISDFEIASNKAGGPEFSLSYIITRVKPVKSFKACPIF